MKILLLKVIRQIKKYDDEFKKINDNINEANIEIKQIKEKI